LKYGPGPNSIIFFIIGMEYQSGKILAGCPCKVKESSSGGEHSTFIVIQGACWQIAVYPAAFSVRISVLAALLKGRRPGSKQHAS
jgi:hypothetical protein